MLTTRRWPALLLATIFATMLAAGCGSGSSSSSSTVSGGGSGTTAVAATPSPLSAGGEFLFCTDVPYPPAETQQGNDFVGYEIDIAKEVARRIGTHATFQKTGFDGIIAALNAKRCDGIISSMNDTPERQKQVNFVDYMKVGQSLMAKPSLKDSIKSLDDLAGRDVAVQVGTTLRDTLLAKSKELQGKGKPAIKVSTFPDAGAAAAALKTNKVDVFFGDSPVVAQYVNSDPAAFAFAGQPIDPLPVGIALRKSDTQLRDAVQKAVDGMYADGTMDRILGRWKIKDFALTQGK